VHRAGWLGWQLQWAFCLGFARAALAVVSMCERATCHVARASCDVVCMSIASHAPSGGFGLRFSLVALVLDVKTRFANHSFL
jgi:hypothetical protein